MYLHTDIDINTDIYTVKVYRRKKEDYRFSMPSKMTILVNNVV